MPRYAIETHWRKNHRGHFVPGDGVREIEASDITKAAQSIYWPEGLTWIWGDHGNSVQGWHGTTASGVQVAYDEDGAAVAVPTGKHARHIVTVRRILDDD